jgi:hypothetical protein
MEDQNEYITIFNDGDVGYSDFEFQIEEKKVSGDEVPKNI